MPKGVEALGGLFLPLVGAREGEHGGVEVGRAQGALEEPGMHARCEPMGSLRRPEGRESDAPCGAASSVCGGAEGAWATGATHGGRRRRTVGVIALRGRQEPGGVPRRFPGGAEPRAGLGGQGARAVCGALPTGARDLGGAAQRWQRPAGRGLRAAGGPGSRRWCRRRDEARGEPPGGDAGLLQG